MRGRCTTGTGGPRAKHQQTRGVSLSSPLPLSPLPARRAVLWSCLYDAMCLCKAKEPATRVAIPTPPIPNQGRSDPMRSLATACQGRAAGSLTPLTVEEAQIPAPTHRQEPQLSYLGKGFIAMGAQKERKQQRRDTKACGSPTRKKTGASAARRKEEQGQRKAMT